MWTVKEQDFLLEGRDALKMLSQAEELESYNRRNNVKINELPEITGRDSDDQPIFENYNQTSEKVLELSGAMSAGVEKCDISFAHRLPSANRNVPPIKVHFALRSAKIVMLKKKVFNICREFEKCQNS